MLKASEIIEELKQDARPPNKLTQTVGALIRQAREEASLSQVKLAKLVERTQASISALEQGKAEPSLSTLLFIALMLERPLHFFVPIRQLQTPEEQMLTNSEHRLLSAYRQIANYEQHTIDVMIQKLAEEAYERRRREYKEEYSHEEYAQYMDSIEDLEKQAYEAQEAEWEEHKDNQVIENEKIRAWIRSQSDQDVQVSDADIVLAKYEATKDFPIDETGSRIGQPTAQEVAQAWLEMKRRPK
jgi:transcriptional regulator with XRE-family HTH domain